MQVYLLLMKVTRVSHAECGCVGTFLLTSPLSGKVQTLQFSVLMLWKIKDPNIESFLVTERY